ncbi:MAG: dihydroorotate dehydrogenase electron transfer subunit [Bacteroidales bacterium]|nr:dihydroorotate dehydrogenase electron transfer subunit [Bacteroidales bacterium]
MKQSDFTVRENVRIAEKTWRMCLEGDTSPFVRGGQFIDLRLDGRFLRRPFAVQKWDSESLTLIYKTVGEGTREMTGIRPGTVIDALTGLGNGFDADASKQAALVVCGGLGASPAFTLVKDLLAGGRTVTVILGFNTAAEAILYEDYCALGADTRLVTVDGSAGLKGLVTDALAQLNPVFDYFYTCGPKVMMKAVCGAIDGPGEVSLEERMGCGCGICYGCTCHTVKGPARVCADGPVFKKEDVIW